MSSHNEKRRNILQLMRDREINADIRLKYALKNEINVSMISKLGSLSELKGHEERVNCLQWNESGSTLASASDNNQVILWDPFLKNIKTEIKTLHSKIFSVKFLPNGNSNTIITAGTSDWSTHTYNVTTGYRLSACSCARGPVKRIAVANDTPCVYWSASQDGFIRQHDIRMSHKCNSDASKINLLSVYDNLGKNIKAQCLDINQCRTEQLAVGTSDPYVRLYDRRMINSYSNTVKCPFPKNLSEADFKVDDNNTLLKYTNHNVAQYFIPGYLNKLNINCRTGITYVTFSPDGQELLANYSSEYIYLYNILNEEESAFCNIPNVMKSARKNGEGTSTDAPVESVILPDKIELLKLKANISSENNDYTEAITLYNEAIDIFKCSVLFSNRAVAYINRKWNGDIYAALRDCVSALKLDPDNMKAHFNLVICLFELRKIKDSKIYLDLFSKKYPSQITHPAFVVLVTKILDAQFNGLSELKEYTDHVQEFDDCDSGSEYMSEEYYRSFAKDYQKRFYGHCNVFLDTMEANYFGNNFIVAGSDDGFIFIWDKKTENNMLILDGDRSYVNSLQPHPTEFMLATCGLSPVVKLWTPLPDDYENVYEKKQIKDILTKNQSRMKIDTTQYMWDLLRRDLTPRRPPLLMSD